MKILIVDDETILRERILSVLKNSGLPFSAFLTAENAFDAVELVNREQPEIVLTDIRMPQKSGLELAQYIHETAPETVVILITGYSEFEYARTALQNNVFDYLLKPVETERLVSVVLAAQRQIETRDKHNRLFRVFKEHFASNLDSIRKQWIENLLFRTGAARDADRQCGLYGVALSRYRLVAISCSTAIDNSKLEGEYYCTHLVEAYIAEHRPGAVTYVFGSLVFLLWAVTADDLFDDTESLLGFLRDLHAYVRRNFLGMLSAGVSRVSDTLANIQSLRHQTSTCLEYLRDQGRREFLLYEDIMDADSARWEAEGHIEALTAALGSGSTEQALRLLDGMLAEARAESPENLYSICLLIVSGVSFVLRDCCPGAEDTASLVSPLLVELGTDTERGLTALRGFVERIGNAVAGERNARTNALVEAVRAYISAMYKEPVGLAECARHIGRNPSYISRLVREHTGKSFTQLLTDKRMAEAKRLLKETNLKIGEIAERTGYTNVRYFTRVFKAAAGMSANDYRNFSTVFQ